jgi:DNA-binding NtrC family response regulator
MTEILNIDYHRRRLVLKALNTLPTKSRARKELGISERQLYRYIQEYGIKKDRKGRYYIDSSN